MSETKELEEKAVGGLNEAGDVEDDANNVEASAGGPTSKKKKKKLLGKLFNKDSEGQGPADVKSESKLTPEAIQSLLQMNPSLRAEIAGMDKPNAAETLRSMNVADFLTGLSIGGKNQKDMASHKFWQTQPVPRSDDRGEVKEGPIKIINPEEVSKDPDPLIEGFEWCTMDLTDETELLELYDLLSNHYVEDDNAMFRFNYSKSFLKWYVSAVAPRSLI
jgi:glycylpeptide N-tetradecanoyltransferase